MATGGRLTDLTSKAAVHKAMERFREMGRDAFIAEYSAPEAGFTRSRDFFVVEDGIGYDSKPLVAAAYGFQHGRNQALHSDDFSGGAPVIKCMAALGFKVVEWTSGSLKEGQLYTREALREQFKITDATVDTGVFRPKDTNSIWLFVTRDKTRDRTQYLNRLEGDRLYWQGQSKGRTDAAIIGHEANDDELLVFYRESKRQHPGAGFRLEGRFRYLSHQGQQPASFVLQRWSEQSDLDVSDDPFDPSSIEDGRRKVWAQVKRRQGQPAFRRKLLRAYGGACAITGCTIEDLLEAAHIHPYRGEETNVVSNGLLLRADIHTLFDCGLLAITADRTVIISQRLTQTDYAHLSAHRLRMPTSSVNHPSPQACAWHRKSHGFEDK